MTEPTNETEDSKAMEADTPKKKHKLDCEKPNDSKKQKDFSAKEFRKELQTNNRSQAINKFLSIINTSESEDHIFSYLENGGSIAELLQQLELDSNISPSIIFEIIAKVLIRINANYPQYQNSCYENCRYILNNYITLINKMLGLSSSAGERNAVLSLLTAMVTSSPVLARDVLLHVPFHQTNLELLTKPTPENRTVRSSFIHFLTAFLVEEHYQSLSILLEKKGMFTSIINGLQYDNADTVCLVVTAMKNGLLENPFISKTVKMKVFNTPVVRDLVKLYNWKGSKGLVQRESIKVNEIQKSRVSEAIHEFLLILCASHKYGVIFRDPQLGLGKKNLNSLMFTVLESLERPWEHSYACQLVSKICSACPDLIKTMWNNMKPFLEVRDTPQWLKTVKFAMRFLKEMDPGHLELVAKEMSVYQIQQVIIILIMPYPIVKTIIVEEYPTLSTKQHVVALLVSMVSTLERFVNLARTYLTHEDYTSLKKGLGQYILKNFPNGLTILSNWEGTDNSTIEKLTLAQHLRNIFKIFSFYKELAPQLLDSITEGLDLNEFLSVLKLECSNEEHYIQTKVIEIFIDLEKDRFKCREEFGAVFKILIEVYFNERTEDSLTVLKKLLACSIFEGSEWEIRFWINGFLELKGLEIIDDFLEALELTKKNLVDYIDVLNDKEDNLIERISSRKRYLSPFIIGFLEYINEAEASKHLKIYINNVILNLLHSNSTVFEKLSNYSLDKRIVEYFKNWKAGTKCKVPKLKGKLNSNLIELSETFLFGQVDSWPDSSYPDFYSDLVQMIIFHLNCTKNIEPKHEENLHGLMKHLNEKGLFNEDIFYSLFVLFRRGKLFKEMILNHLNDIRNKYNVNNYLQVVRDETVCTLIKDNFDKSKLDILKCIGLGLEQSLLILKAVKDDKCSELLETISFALDTINENSDSIEPIDQETFSKVAEIYSSVTLNQDVDISGLSKSFHGYLVNFPWALSNVNKEVFNNLLKRQYKKEIVDFCCFLLKVDFVDDIKELDSLIDKKSVLLPLLQVLIESKSKLDFLQAIYEKLKSSIDKLIQKPQKAGQHFQLNYKTVSFLIEQFMPQGQCLKLFEKVQKFEVTEVFHVEMLKQAALKALKSQDCSANVVLTFLHLILNLFKRKDDGKVLEIVERFKEVLPWIKGQGLEKVAQSEAFKLYCKYSLKFGVGQDGILLEILSDLFNLASSHITEEEATVTFDMLLSHSSFLDSVLNETSSKKSIFKLFHTICQHWKLMEKNHIPVLLASYKASLSESDQIILELLKIYEEAQVGFYDYKPYLWDKAAANHYSVRLKLENALWRQPKVSDVLNILQESMIRSTISSYCLKNNEVNEKVYDLRFLLPLFSQLLASENQVQTYKFSRSGALSLTIIGLSCENKEVRQGACFVLSRYYFHLEARQGGKDNLLWIRFIEVVCKGTADMPDFKLNNFAAIYLARMALILTQPTHVMYLPLSQYLAAKESLDFSTVPELYSLLHSSDVNYLDHRHFILTILKDGLKTEKDLSAFLKSMAPKLFSELYSSCVSDPETQLLILDIFTTACKLNLGVKILIENHSFLTQIFGILENCLKLNKDKKLLKGLTEKIIIILNDILKAYKTNHSVRFIFNMCQLILNSWIYDHLEIESLNILFETVFTIYSSSNCLFDEKFFNFILDKKPDRFCKGIVKFGCNFINEICLDKNVLWLYYMRMLFVKYYSSEVYSNRIVIDL